MPHIVVVDKAVGVTSKSVHVPITSWNATVTHDDRHLMQRFGKERPEIPVVIGTPQIGFRVAFHSMVQVWELQRVAKEKNRCVVSDQVPDSFIGIKFQGKKIGRASCRERVETTRVVEA